MKFNRAKIIATSILFLGSSLTAYAQPGREKGKDDRPDKHEGPSQQGAQRGPAQHPQKQAQPAPQRAQQEQRGRQQEQADRQQQQRQQPQQQRAKQQQEQARPEQRAHQGPSPQQAQRSRQNAMAWQQKKGWLGQGGWQGNNDWQRSRARRWDNEHRTWAQRGGYGGYYIPSDRWVLSFGQQHGFRIRNRPVIYMGYPRFDYGGFSFMIVDPWPEYWAENWYDSDDVYIDYEDGYYLYDRRYPRVRLAISVVL